MVPLGIFEALRELGFGPSPGKDVASIPGLVVIPLPG